jgi:hypothetical protein
MSNDQERSYFDEFIANPKNWVVFEQERLAENVGEFVLDTLEARGASQVKLAAALDKSPAVISRLVSGGSNMTLRTMVELLAAVGYQMRIEYEPIPSAVADYWQVGESGFCNNVCSLVAHHAQEGLAASAARASHHRCAVGAAEAVQEFQIAS